MEISIERAHADDGAAIAALLEQHHLPVEGLADHLKTTLVARRDGQVVGSAGLELYPQNALLRSVAVAANLQCHGLGQRLTLAAIEVAQGVGVSAIYLLTTTADSYFPKFGFERIQRAEVPASVQTSVEFTSACPNSATVMRKVL